MALQLILGPAGSGKSTYVMEQIAAQLKQNRRRKIIVMVPEQATFCYQADLVNKYGLSGVMTLEILSFQRLARSILQQTGGLARPMLDKLGKLLIFRRILQQDTERYPYLSHSIDRPGYLLKLCDTVQECKRYQVSCEQLEQICRSEELPQSVLTQKLQEISALYTGYEAFLEQDYMDSEDLLDYLLQELKQTDTLRDTDIWIDEFYDFTPQELNIIELLMQKAANVHLILPWDTSEDLGRSAVFQHAGRLVCTFQRMARKNGVAVNRPVICSRLLRWSEAEELAFLEQQYFSLNFTVCEQTPQQVHLTQAQNRMSEVDAVARSIRRLCREKGYRYADIGIYTRGDQYEQMLEHSFTDYEIPFFLDEKKPLKEHPLTELILAVFDVLRTGWNYNSVFRFLKTDLLPYPRSLMDRLENYVLQYGIHGATWYQEADWQYGTNLQEEELAELNNLRRMICAPLYSFQEQASAQCVREWIRLLYQLLEDYDVPQQLSVLCEETYRMGYLAEAQVHQQIWDHVIQILDQMDNLLADQPLSAEEFSTILRTAFDNLDLGLLPNSLDQVFVGALAHSRSRNLKVVFVLGLNEGILPARTEQNGFFLDYEKDLLRQLGVSLSPNASEQLFDEQFLLYLALTRGSQALYMSYSLCDAEGKALRPSAVVSRVKTLFPALQEQVVQWPPADGADVLDYLSHPDKAAGLLGMHLMQEAQEQPQIWGQLYNWFLHHSTPLFDAVQNSLQHEQVLRAKQLQTNLFGSPLRVSVSSLERYRQCPYSYFLSYGLRLQERKLYQMEAVDVGQFYHAAIERFSRYILDKQLTWESLDEAQVRHIMRQVVEELAPEMQNEILLSSGRYRYLKHRLQKTLERSALYLMEHGKRGSFVPVVLEAGFGLKDSTMPAWTIELQDGTRLVLQGRIDRVETAEQDGCHYLRVIDFKSGSAELKLSDVYYGLRLQLLAYLKVALQYFEAQGITMLPAAVLYYYFRDGILTADGPVNSLEAQRQHLANMKANGLLVADMHALQAAQKNLETGASPILPLNLLKTAEEYFDNPDSYAELEDPLKIFRKPANSVVTIDELQLLLRHVEETITSLGEQIHRGNIALQPCRTDSFHGCDYCSYQAICQIQTADLQELSTYFPKLDRDSVMQTLQQKEEVDGHADLDSRTAAGN